MKNFHQKGMLKKEIFDLLKINYQAREIQDQKENIKKKMFGKRKKKWNILPKNK